MIIKLFKEITKIPRCSGTHKPFITYMQEFCKKYSYTCTIDEANNILCYKEDKTPLVCLQSHYDIVCLEDNKIPQIIEENGILKAKDSTLGADNGMGCAYMLALMAKDEQCEFLFTCDEEIGLIGANNITLDIKSTKMLNLDSEEMGNICIGCAGGIDIFATTTKSEIIANTSNKDLYEIEIKELDGGHSGVDINKNIPNAIKLLIQTIKECNADIIDINAGERINSIPKNAKAIIASNKTPKASIENMSIVKIDVSSEHYKKIDSSILEFIYDFKNGVLKFDDELDVVIDSINLAIISTDINETKIQLSARSMDNDNLKNISLKTVARLENLGFTVRTDGKYPAWFPSKNNFCDEILKVHKKHFESSSLYAIHAGLECAIFKEKYPNLEIASIGPDIFFPHSNREYCNIKSAYKVYEILEEIIDKLKGSK